MNKNKFYLKFSLLAVLALEIGISSTQSFAKPQFPIEIQSNLSGEVRANTPLNLIFEITSQKECSSLHSNIRGLEGVTLSGGVEKNHIKLEKDKSVSHEVSLVIGAGMAGYAVIEVHCTFEGATHTVSKTVALKTKGSIFKKSKSKLGKDEKGEPVILMKPGTP